MSKKLLFSILFLSLTLIFIGTTIFVSYVTNKNLQANLINEYTNQEKVVADQVARLMEIEVESLIVKLNLIATLPEVNSGSTEDCNEKLKEVLNDAKVQNLGRIGVDGKFKCSLNQALIGVPGSNLGQYVIDIFEDPDHKPVMSRTIVPPGVKSHVVAVHVPVFDKNGEFNGTLGGALYFDLLQEKYLQKIIFAERGNVVLLDDDGTVIYHPELSLIGKKVESEEGKKYYSPGVLDDIFKKVKNGESGTLRYFFGNTEKIGSYEPVNIFEGRKWIVLVTVPVEVVSQITESVGVGPLLLKFGIILALVSILAGSVFYFVMIKSVFNPLTQMQDTLSSLGKGDFDVSFKVNSNDEIGKLSKAFNLMAIQLKDSYQTLEDKVTKRTAELLSANDKLEKLDKLKDEFLSIASHELRTPLTAIDGLVAMIREGEYGKVPNDLMSPLDDVNSASERLIHLVNDLLNLSRIRAGRLKYDLKNFTLKSAMEETITLFSGKAKEKDIDLKLGRITELAVQSDIDKVKQIISNLVGNAMKFTDTGKIVLTAEEEGDFVVVKITDSGIGIADEDKDKLFGQFQQIGNQVSRPAGTGLGLYLSKLMAQQMGGDVWLFESGVGKGSVFALSLPKVDSTAAQETSDKIDEEASNHPDQKSG